MQTMVNGVIEFAGTVTVPASTGVPEQARQVDQLTVHRMVDSPKVKRVRVIISEVGALTLWEGDAYDTIGQWTDQDVVDRVMEILAPTSSSSSA